MRLRLILYLISLLQITSILSAQSLLFCQIEDEVLPVAEVKAGRPLCFTGDSLIKGSSESVTMVPERSFGQGFIDVEIIRNERDGVADNGGVLEFTAHRSWYLLVCKLVPDRDLTNCYFTLKLDSYGEKSHYLGSLGDLVAGEEKMLRVFVKLKYEMPDQLHIFSGMEEIRTSLVHSVYQYEEGELIFAAR